MTVEWVDRSAPKIFKRHGVVKDSAGAVAGAVSARLWFSDASRLPVGDDVEYRSEVELNSGESAVVFNDLPEQAVAWCEAVAKVAVTLPEHLRGPWMTLFDNSSDASPETARQLADALVASES